MKREILNIINEQGTIFKNKCVFQMGYVPEIWKFREREFGLMATYCRSLTENIAPQHLLITGDYATGKTTTLKQFLEVLNDNFDKVRTVYINCKLNKTEYQIYSRIYQQLNHIKQPINGYNTKHLFEKIIEKLLKENLILILALDDFDSIKNREELNKALYNLLRVHEVKKGVQISIFSVSNMGDLLIDPIVQTIFNRVEIKFDNYSLSQMNEILKDRCMYGFFEGVISEDTVRIVAERAYTRGNLRYGINLLSQLGDLAEAKGESEVKFRKVT